jgi:hypothetical protein
MGDALFRIIGRDSQIVRRAAVAPQDHEIVYVRIPKSHLLVDHVLPYRFSLGDQKPDGMGLSALGTLLGLSGR